MQKRAHSRQGPALESQHYDNRYIEQRRSQKLGKPRDVLSYAQDKRQRDPFRHPKETLEFFGIRQEMTVMEIWPGAGGWYAEILAPVLKDKGRYVAAGWDPKSEIKFVQDGIKAFQSKLDANPEIYGKTEVAALQLPNASLGNDSVCAMILDGTRSWSGAARCIW